MKQPDKKYKCMACLRLWNEDELYDDPMYTYRVFTCGDIFCGGRCLLVKELDKEGDKIGDNNGKTN